MNIENPLLAAQKQKSRRQFLGKMGLGLGTVALGSLLTPGLFDGDADEGLPPGLAHFAPKAKRVIYLFQSGAPSQFESFEHKPMLQKMAGQSLPESIRKGQRLTTMTSGQTSFPLVPPAVGFKQYGQSGAWVSDFFPHIGRVADDLCFINSMHTEQINHDPAITFLQSGNQQAGRPSMGAWVSYGLGSANKNLPAFVVLTSRGGGNAQGLYAHLWSAGYLDAVHQGVLFRGGKDPVLYLKDPDGLDRPDRRKMLDALAELNEQTFAEFADPEIRSRIEQYEMAFRMQLSVGDVTDLGAEPDSILKLYGSDCLKPGTYAANCLLARRLCEKGVRFIQLYHQGWDQHSNLIGEFTTQARQVDQASAALIADLKQRGLLDETLVIWGGEFGRSNYCQGNFDAKVYGRDHHPRAFSIWMAGGGVRPGQTWGETDELGYNIVRDPVHVHDLHATMLHLLGLDHEKLTFKYQGRRFRLTDVAGQVVNGIMG